MKIKYVEERFENQVFFDNQINEKEVNNGNSKRVPVLLLSDFEKSKKELIDKMNEAIDSVELAGYDNPIDEAYHNACLMMKEIVVECFGVEK